MKRVFIAACALAVSLGLFTTSTIADAPKARKKAAEGLAREISRLRFQNLYVADFHQIRLVQSVEQSLDQASVDIMRTWLFEPGRNFVETRFRSVSLLRLHSTATK